ncbi:MAG TPA: HAMP domain-containing sensor histidine kinase [Stellaceae bacterium]|nr:HAMP domain-containing sensor histidine kinase [Stellaceae bacterium]
MAQESDAWRSVLLVDRDFGFAQSLAGTLRPRGYAALYADTPERAVAILHDPPDGSEPAPVALIDARLGGVAGGVDLIPRLRVEQPELVCVVMTHELDTATALAALRRGAYDYIEKSCDAAALFAVLDRCFDRVAMQLEREAGYEALRLERDDAEAASRSKSGFLATMSHELRTPLNAIIGFSEMILREVFGTLGNEQYRAYVSDIHESGSHLLQIINDILDLSKAEAGKLVLHEDVFDLRDTIRAVRQLTRDRIHSSGLVERIELPAGLPLLRADERKTKQVLLNLVTNAIKFTPPGGHIEIAGSFEAASGLTLSVSDSGIGIPPADLDRVLRPFEQVECSLSRTNQGTGLGLPLVKAIMELHGGTIALDSTVGIGTRVAVTFPPRRAVFDADAVRSRSAA